LYRAVKYASPAWQLDGFLGAEDSPKVEAFIRRRIIAGFCPPLRRNFETLCHLEDKQMCDKILDSPDRMFAQVSSVSQNYSVDR